MDRGQQRNRRQVLEIFTIGGVATALVMPTSWTKPLVKSVIVPAHAQASPHGRDDGGTTTPAPPTTQAPATTTPNPFCEPGDTPTQEICDGRDNDCDGIIDNHEACGTTTPPTTEEPPTTTTTQNPFCPPGQQAPETEICDGIDNDCDGVADEGCESNTTTENPFPLCPPGQQVPEAEICDGIDNDCDGEADEGLNCGT